MMQLAAWLEPGGLVMYLLLFGLAPLVAISGLVHIILASRNSFLQLCLCLMLVSATGFLATAWQRWRVADALAAARPDGLLHIAITGYREASRPFHLAFAIVVIGLVPYVLGEMRRARRNCSRRKGP